MSSGDFRPWPICCPQAGFGPEKVPLGDPTGSKTKAFAGCVGPRPPPSAGVGPPSPQRPAPSAVRVQAVHALGRQCCFVIWMCFPCGKRQWVSHSTPSAGLQVKVKPKRRPTSRRRLSYLGAGMSYRTCPMSSCVRLRTRNHFEGQKRGILPRSLLAWGGAFLGCVFPCEFR
jgi:hypothetical protein